jgi:hypothetical protein
MFVVLYGLFGLSYLDTDNDGRFLGYSVRGYGASEKLKGYQLKTGAVGGLINVKVFSPSFFEACDWIKANTPEDARIATLWTHRAAYNCKRYIAGNPADIMLNDDPEEMVELSKKFEMTHIFIQKFSVDPQNRHLQEMYDLSFVQLLDANPDKFDNVYENGPPLDQCIQAGGCDGNIVYEILY